MKVDKSLKFVLLGLIVFFSLFFVCFFIYKILNPELEDIIKYKTNYVEFYLKEATYYVPVESKFKLELHNPDNIAYTVKVLDEKVASLENEELIANDFGKTDFEMYIGNMKVQTGNIYVVKGIEKVSEAFNSKKEKITCDYFTEEENDVLDLTLKNRIDEVGYKTRAGVVAAARFLTLEFDKKIPYFYENGRLNNYGEQRYVDGEGRYYHQGLYLNSSRYESIIASFTGPAAWGCKLKQYQDAKFYGFVPGVKYPNGLDCSGFVSWALLNGGFDVKDSGAGDIISIKDDLYDLGTKEKLNKTLLKSQKIKVGDLIAYPGHMAIIIGIDLDENYYIAESLPQYKGLVVNKYDRKTLLETFTDVMLMDEVYLVDGKVTNMWI